MELNMRMTFPAQTSDRAWPVLMGGGATMFTMAVLAALLAT
jgi:hypothetical protein